MPEDSYGSYEILTGYEGQSKCWWCGAAFPNKRARRFCSTKCRRKYENNFYWAWASRLAVRRAKFCCQACGVKGRRRLHVHHIRPLNGSNRMKNVLNRADNLIVLCKKCHQKQHQSVNNQESRIKYQVSINK
ncbi:MAG: HNH endonuclease signature motif containing protein [Dehalococcoidales bacterium]|nr:HNH endonuclease signature motif containing protein [Dehalococcoidales bacterium]